MSPARKRLKAPPLVILTGAGISAESGIRTFRDQNGLWENHRIEDVATPQAFYLKPDLVHEFYNMRRRQLLDPDLRPNAAHLALARLERSWPNEIILVTQNVDNLHERAGSRHVFHMHGELQKAWCQACDERIEWTIDLSRQVECPKCGVRGKLRPDIVWFGEMPYHMHHIEESLKGCGIFIAVGTSGMVYPAAGFARWAAKAKKFEVNTQETPVSGDFTEALRGPASEEIPRLVERLMEEYGTLD